MEVSQQNQTKINPSHDISVLADVAVGHIYTMSLSASSSGWNYKYKNGRGGVVPWWIISTSIEAH